MSIILEELKEKNFDLIKWIEEYIIRYFTICLCLRDEQFGLSKQDIYNKLVEFDNRRNKIIVEEKKEIPTDDKLKEQQVRDIEYYRNSITTKENYLRKIKDLIDKLERADEKIGNKRTFLIKEVFIETMSRLYKCLSENEKDLEYDKRRLAELDIDFKVYKVRVINSIINYNKRVEESLKEQQKQKELEKSNCAGEYLEFCKLIEEVLK